MKKENNYTTLQEEFWVGEFGDDYGSMEKMGGV